MTTRGSSNAQGTLMAITIEAEPYLWPYDGDMVPERTALMLIDWQHDFCGPGGYVDKMGYDISLTRRGVGPTRRVLDACRAIPGFTIIHTREGHKPDLSDCPPNKRWRSQRIGAGIGEMGPCGRILVRGRSRQHRARQTCRSCRRAWRPTTRDFSDGKGVDGREGRDRHLHRAIVRSWPAFLPMSTLPAWPKRLPVREAG